MTFIIPKNYNFKNKLFGFLDYSTIILNLVWGLFIYSIFSIFMVPFYIKMFLFIVLCFPLFIFSLIGFNHENIIYCLYYIFRYLKNPKIYLYK